MLPLLPAYPIAPLNPCAFFTPEQMLTFTIPWGNDNPFQARLPLSSCQTGGLHRLAACCLSSAQRHALRLALGPQRGKASPAPVPTQHLLACHTAAARPCCRVQLIKHVTRGGRLPIPEPREIPGAEGGPFAGLDDYVALIQRYAARPFLCAAARAWAVVPGWSAASTGATRKLLPCKAMCEPCCCASSRKLPTLRLL